MQRLFLYLTRNTAPLASRLSTEGPVVGVVGSLPDAERLQAPIAQARLRGREVILQPGAWRMQLELSHPKRPGLRRSGLEWSRRQFAPDATPASADVIDEIAERYYQAQLEAGATALVSPSHYYRRQLGDGRALDLAVASRFSEIFRSQLLPDAERQALVIDVPVSPSVLDSSSIGQLVPAYTEIECDAYWISVWDFTPSAQQYKRVRELAKRLEIASGRPCIVQGIRHLWLAAIANGISGACFGWGSLPTRNHLLPPVANDRRSTDEARGVALYFSDILGVVGVGPRFAEARRMLLERAGCGCGNHRRGQPPRRQIDHHAHNLHVAEELAVTMSRGEPADATAALGPRIRRASSLRGELALPALPRAWEAVSQPGSWGLTRPRVVDEEVFWRRAA